MQNQPSEEMLGYAYLKFSDRRGRKNYSYLFAYAAQAPTTTQRQEVCLGT